MAKDLTLKTPDGQTELYPKTVSDLVYDNATGRTQKQMNDASSNPEYNVSLLYPTGGTSGTNIYTLAGAISVLNSALTSAEKVRGVKVIFYDSASSIKAYYFKGSSYSNFGTESYWQETPDFMDANGVGGAYDISAAHNNATYADLTAALGTNGANVPEGIRKGGMSVKFVQTSDNKYVCYMLTKPDWSADVNYWEKINIEGEVVKINTEIYGVDFEQPSLENVEHKYITSEGVWVNNSNYSVIVDVSGIKGYHVTQSYQTAGNMYAFLKSYNDTSVVFIDGGGRITGKLENTLVPNDATYLYLYLGNNEPTNVPTLTTDAPEGIIPQLERLNVLPAQVTELNEEISPIVQVVDNLDWQPDIYKFDQSNNSKAILLNNIVLSQNGDSIEFVLKSCSYKNFADAGQKGYAFTKNPNSTSLLALGITRDRLSMRADDSTWLFLNTEFGGSAVGKTIKVAYENDVINAYVNNVIVGTYNGQKTVTISSFGDGSSYGYWDGSFSKLKINGNDVELSSISTLSNVEIVTPSRSFLSSDEQTELNNASLPLMMVEKSINKIIVYKKLEGNRYIAYPLEHRELSYATGQYPSFEDNWGVWKPYIAEFSNNAMSMVLDIFNSGEAELALNVPRGDGESGNVYVGGGAHGFEIIEETEEREFVLLIDSVKYDEDSVIPLQAANSVVAQQGSNLYQAYTNTNPFAYTHKKWEFTENKNLQITTKIKILRSIQIANGQFGMFSVYRHSEGVVQNDYLTDRAIKDNNPFTTYNIEDGWTSIATNIPLRTPDYNCKKITEYGQLGLGFTMSVKDANTKEGGGMFVTTNSSVYNKIYFSLCNNYNATTDEVLYATQEWSIEGNYTES